LTHEEKGPYLRMLVGQLTGVMDEIEDLLRR
jgi:hypothetical protein